MRRPALAAATVLIACLPASPASAHPGHAYEEVAVQADARTFNPAAIRIFVNQGILWRWQPGLVFPDHSVTADEGQSEEFDSGTRQSGTFLHVFRKEGTYTYHCAIHPSMTGSVEVRPLPGMAPRLTRLRVSPGVEPVARFKSSKGGYLVGRIADRKNGGWDTEKSFEERARKGRTRLELPRGGLDPGRYRLTLTVYDFRGRSASAQDRFRLE